MKFDRNKVAFLSPLLVVAGFSLVCCGAGPSTSTTSSTRLTTRVVASQSVSSPTAFPGLLIIDGEIDTLVRGGEIGAGSSPGLMAISPDRATVLAFNSTVNNWAVEIVGTPKASQSGSVQLPGPTTSMVALDSGFGYAAVPSAPFEAGPSPGAVEVMNLPAGSLAAKKKVPVTSGTFPTHGPLFVGLLVGTVVIIAVLTYFPAVSLGPIVEHYLMQSGRLFSLIALPLGS